jgi:hypothetical protein
MRLAVAVLLVLIAAGSVSAQSRLITRYNLDYDPNSYPQSSPKEALASVIKAILDKRVDYQLAHLTDPAFVDDQVQNVHNGKFDELVRAVKAKLANDPETIKVLQRFAKEADWEMGETAASAKVKDLKERVFFRKVESRWFFENRKAGAAEKEKDKGEK